VSCQNILFSLAGSVATITLNQPETLNALNQAMAEELTGAVKSCAGDAAVRAVVITGAGRGFSSGGDLRAMKQALDAGADPASFFQEPLTAIGQAVVAIRQCPKPVLAAINGPAAGAGMNLALACDLRLASDRARFTEAFMNLGLIPDAGGTFLLPRLVGLAKATELLLTGEVIDAAEAYRLGIVHKVVPEERFPAAVVELATMLALRPTAAVGRLKRLLNASLSADGFAAQVDSEQAMQVESGRTEDFLEGLRAFLTKTPAQFRGR
jgi:2-(1,2-epoxy-1,2-dihydrophenyl)acetyl-CoA isomerase